MAKIIKPHIRLKVQKIWSGDLDWPMSDADRNYSMETTPEIDKAVAKQIQFIEGLGKIIDSIK